MEKLKVHAKTLRDEGNPMLSCEWRGAEDMKLVRKPRPMITEPGDVIVHVTTTTICGSDLHMYFDMVPGMEKGDVLGHEFMGIIDQVGPNVKNLQKGDRVVVSAVIACGECYFCEKKLFSCCETTNPSTGMDDLYGDRTAGIFGYTHLTGGFDGGQAEYARVPLGDINCLKIPSGVPDEKVLLLSDVACTGWQASVYLGHVDRGDTVAVWGCGPVGLMAMAWAKFRGASRIIGIDHEPYRLQFAREKIGVETINFDKEDVVKTLKQYFPRGPDVAIEAAGFRFPKTLSHQIQRAVKLESDSVDNLTECMKSVRKGGRVVQIADYFGTTNQFPTGAIQLKALKMLGGQVHVQRYWHELLDYIVKGQFDPSFIITHHMPFERIEEAYKMFAHHEDNCVKVLLHTPLYYEMNRTM